MNLTKKQFVAKLDPIVFNTKYRGEKRLMYVTIDVTYPCNLKKLHDVFGKELGVWNKHRKSNSKLLKHDVDYRDKLAFRMVHRLARNTNFGVVVN